VSGFCGELDLDPADSACPWLSSWQVASVVSWIWSLLMTLVLGLQEVSGFHGKLDLDCADNACPWLYQPVSGFCGELGLDPADNACPWLSRE